MIFLPHFAAEADDAALAGFEGVFQLAAEDDGIAFVRLRC